MGEVVGIAMWQMLCACMRFATGSRGGYNYFSSFAKLQMS